MTVWHIATIILSVWFVISAVIISSSYKTVENLRNDNIGLRAQLRYYQKKPPTVAERKAKVLAYDFVGDAILEHEDGSKTRIALLADSK